MKIDRKKLSTGVRKAVADNYISMSLDGIRRIDGGQEYWNQPFDIEAKIHRIVLTGNYEFTALQQGLGDLYVDDSFKPSERMPNYRTKLIKNQSDFTLIIFVNPINYRPPCLIEIHPQRDVSIHIYKSFLTVLNNAFPGLTLSLVEYALDQYCLDHHAVENLFWTEMRYLYVPYQRMSRVDGELLMNWGENTRMNSVYRIADIVKVYERGPDNKKKRGYWQKGDLNKVRLEFSALRRHLLSNGIDTLMDFIDHPKFKRINKSIYSFRCFTNSSVLPRYWQAYTHEDEKGNVGAFQTECIHYRKKVNNINQYMMHMVGFEELRNRFLEVMEQFDKDWAGAARHIIN
jgi:hypothetical protein